MGRSESNPGVASFGPIEVKEDHSWRPGAAVGIVGGQGEMGRLFARFFSDKGYAVHVADIGTALTGRDVVTRSDVVLFAVPLHQSVAIIRDLIPYTRPEQLLLDVTSLKTRPVQEMLRSKASVVGLHPMFGGRIGTFAGQTLVACPVRVREDDWRGLRELFSSVGILVKETSPEEHDRMMSIIQVLFHMTTMLTGRVLRELNVDIAETLHYTSPSYRLEINLIGRMFAQSPALYSAITQMNPYTGELLNLLKNGLDAYEDWYRKEDLGAFIEDFERSAQHLGPFCGGAYEESSAFLDWIVRVSQRNGRPSTSEGDLRTSSGEAER
ncbi:MAG: prephenate dehydrogenase/arogenate dehydrogenase family protein [Syntrophobacteraceae bacterium]